MLSATLLWMDDGTPVAGRNYMVKAGRKTLRGTVSTVEQKIDINSRDELAAGRVHTNELVVCVCSLAEDRIFGTFENNGALGGLILMDRVSNATSAAGIINHSLRRATNVIWEETAVTREHRSNMKAQKPLTLWFTGLSGSGKSTLANAVEQRLAAMGRHTMLLDGDNVRHGLNKNLGFRERSEER